MQPATPPLSPPAPILPRHHINELHFSPSKARAQARLTQQLTEITAWLEQLFAPELIPKHLRGWQAELLNSGIGSGLGSGFEESAKAAGADLEGEVLKWLRGAKEENVRLRETLRLLDRARQEELAVLRAREAWLESERMVVRRLLDAVYEQLGEDGKMAAEELARGSLLVAATPGQGTEGMLSLFTGHIHDYAVRMDSLLLTVEELKGLRAEVELNLALLKNKKVNPRGADDISGETRYDESQGDEIRSQTAQFARETKQIGTKISEYKDRIEGLEKQVKMAKLGVGLGHNDDLVGEVLETQHRIASRRSRIREMEQRLLSFGGLPPDLAASRDEVKKAQGRLEELKRVRNDMFKMISDG